MTAPTRATGGRRPPSTGSGGSTGELFESDAVEDELVAVGVAVDPEALSAQWRETVRATLSEATLDTPPDGVMQTGGRTGRHSESFAYLIGELQIVARCPSGGDMVTTADRSTSSPATRSKIRSSRT